MVEQVLPLAKQLVTPTPYACDSASHALPSLAAEIAQRSSAARTSTRRHTYIMFATYVMKIKVPRIHCDPVATCSLLRFLLKRKDEARRPPIKCDINVADAI